MDNANVISKQIAIAFNSLSRIFQKKTMRTIKMNVGERFWISCENKQNWLAVRLLNNADNTAEKNILFLSGSSKGKKHLIGNGLVYDFNTQYKSEMIEKMGFIHIPSDMCYKLKIDGTEYELHIVENCTNKIESDFIRKRIQVPFNCEVHKLDQCFSCFINILSSEGLKFNESKSDELFLFTFPNLSYPYPKENILINRKLD